MVNFYVSRYEEYEQLMEEALKWVQYATQEENRWELKEALRAMMSFASCMQLSLLHPVLPGGGRELTVLFSPTRRHIQEVKSGVENEFKCVCCKRCEKHKSTKKDNGAVAAFDLDNLEEDFGEEIDDFDGGSQDNDDIKSDSEDKEDKKRPSNKPRGNGKIVPVDSDLCVLSNKGIRHFACESCLGEMKKTGEHCPKCADLFTRANYSSKDEKIDFDGGDHVYCRDVLGGFKASAKLEKIVNYFLTKVPSNDKVMIVSFYKGPLDLLEAMFYEHGIEAARFDGDVSPDERQSCLDRFKTTPSCRVLLMTAQTGGTGLNIAEANHGLFTERYCTSHWFDGLNVISACLILIFFPFLLHLNAGNPMVL